MGNYIDNVLREHFEKHSDEVKAPAVVKTIEYDPNRSARIALLFYADGEKRYIIAVSYTHLDVYKRQVCYSATAKRLQWLAPFSERIIMCLFELKCISSEKKEYFWSIF